MPSPIELLIREADVALRTLFPEGARPGSRPMPGAELSEAAMKDEARRHAGGLMRVNHSGEVCAQALYQGQALTAKLPEVREEMQHAAAEETEHLAWCEARLKELDSKPSLLNPLWYAASFGIGALAGLAGDDWSLGFVAETEHQVSAHLQGHLESLPSEDAKTRAIIQQMDIDEREHAKMAERAGARDLPAPVKTLMGLVSKVMTRTSYYF